MTVKIERNLSLTEVKNRFLRRVMATKKMQWLQVCTKNQIATQQSGCGLERSRGRYDVRGDVELMVGIEPTTFSLRVRCSTIEPHQHIKMWKERGLHRRGRRIERTALRRKDQQR